MTLLRLVLETLTLWLTTVLFKIPLALYNFFLAGVVQALPFWRRGTEQEGLFKNLTSISTPPSSNRSSASDLSAFNEPIGSPLKPQLSLPLPDLASKIVNAVDIVDICRAHGFKVHEHVVQTSDGYLLAIHRIIPRHFSSVPNGRYATRLRESKQPVVYFHHGLLTNSELFVLGDTDSKCLPFLLVERGFDVWLGNNRGNKYSRKHISLSASSTQFWDYSLDEYAMYDIPNTIDYILDATDKKSLSYVGFSQGSAQCLALLSLSPKLNEKINVFIGLSPAMIPKGLSHPLASFFVNSAQSFLYNLFGTRLILPSVVFWQQLMGPKYYKDVVDKSLVLLFGWDSNNISEEQKNIGYQHMFSPSSVKSVVHWLQIIKSKRFQMYDEGGNAGSKLNALSLKHKLHRVAPFPTQTIYTPMLLIYGKADSLIDIDKTLLNLSCPVETIGIDTYEHMDTLWSNDVVEKVFEPVIKKLTEVNFSEVEEKLDETKITENTFINKGEVKVLVNSQTVLLPDPLET